MKRILQGCLVFSIITIIIVLIIGIVLVYTGSELADEIIDRFSKPIQDLVNWLEEAKASFGRPSNQDLSYTVPNLIKKEMGLEVVSRWYYSSYATAKQGRGLGNSVTETVSKWICGVVVARVDLSDLGPNDFAIQSGQNKITLILPKAEIITTSASNLDLDNATVVNTLPQLDTPFTVEDHEFRLQIKPDAMDSEMVCNQNPDWHIPALIDQVMDKDPQLEQNLELAALMLFQQMALNQDILSDTEQKAVEQLTTFLKQLGFKDVQISFEPSLP